MKLTMYATSLLGVWPYIFEDKPILKKLYNYYSKCIFIYYFLFIQTSFIKFFLLINEDIIDIKEVFANLSLSLLHSVTILRIYTLKSARLKRLTTTVIEGEVKIIASKDEKIIKIYKSYTTHSKVSNAIFLGSILLVAALYFIHPLYVEDHTKFDKKKNATLIIRALPLSIWLPYDEQKYYLLSYLWHIVDGSIGASFVVYADIFSFSLIIFPLGQIHILIHILENFEEYAEKVRDQIGCSVEEASFVTLRECILKHKELISYITEFNKAMRNIMVLDFTQSSLQLASIVIQLLVTKMTLMNFAYSSQFAVTMIIRLLVYYWYANEVMVQSTNIAVAFCASRWHEAPQKVKKLLMIIMMRCNRPLGFEIGPISMMSLNTLLRILKATYSYMMVVYRK